MSVQEKANMFQGYLGTCCLINIAPEMQEIGPIPEVSVIYLQGDSSISNNFFFPREVIEQWSTEYSVTLALQRSIRLLQKEYIIKNLEEINKYLLDHKYLLDILLIIPSQIYRIFGNVLLFLQVFKDPEENYECLFIIIKSNYTPTKSFDLLDKLSEEWWLDVDIDIKRLLEIDISTNS